jgi:hypothetical protein
MGNLKMGIFPLVLIMIVLASVLPGIGASEVESHDGISSNAESETNDNEQFESSAGSTRQDERIWYIYTKKEIYNKERSYNYAIVINGSGEFFINNSAKVVIHQNYSHHRYITIKDNGILRLNKGTLVSNYGININLQDNGQLILEQKSDLNVTKIKAKDRSSVLLSSSNISPGIGGLDISISGQATLDLADSTINNADSVNAFENSKLKIRNGNIHSTTFGISCEELTLSANKDLDDLKVQRCEYGYILGSTVTGLEIDTCGFLRVSQKSKVIDSLIKNVKEVTVEDSTLRNVVIEQIETKMTIRNSNNISGVEIINCTTLNIQNSHLKKFNLEHFSNIIDISESKIEQSSILPKTINIYNSKFECAPHQLDILTRASLFDAYNSSFNQPLRFSGNSEAHLTNCTTSGKQLPETVVTNDALVSIYWWLEVQVLDSKEKPVPDVTVSILDFITNNKIDDDITDSEGKVKFRLLANIKTKDGWDTIDGKSYEVRGTLGKKSVEDNREILLEENKLVLLQFKNGKKKEKEDKPLLGTDAIIGIIIFIIVIILVVISLTGRSRKTPKNITFKEIKETPPSRKGSYPRGRNVKGKSGRGNNGKGGNGKSYPPGRGRQRKTDENW